MALTAVGLAGWWWTRGLPAAHGPIVLISIDTLRADRLPVYGYQKVATPALNRLAGDGVVFERAYAHAPQTLPSHASMLTGRLPFEHGARDNLGFQVKTGERMLQHVLGEAGYLTAGFVSSFVLREDTGIAQGFDVYDDELPPASPGASIGQVQRDGAVTADAAVRWIAGAASGRVFVFLHLYEPHTPYRPPERFARFDPYDGEIAYADEIVGRFIGALGERGLYDEATIILLSDHGEGLGDHGEREHGLFIYDESIRIPLIVKLPRSAEAGRRVAAPVQLIDLFPTVVELTGGPPVPDLRGRSLVPLLAGGDPEDGDTAVYSESLYARYHFGWSELTALTTARFRYIKAPREELYDLANDPGERRNIVGERAETRQRLRQALDELTAGTTIGAPTSVSEETRGRLQALGYVAAGGAVSSDVEGATLPDPKDQVEVLEKYRRAVDLASERQLPDALVLLREIVADQPAMADVWQQIGALSIRVGRTGDGIAAYRRFIELKPTDPGGPLAMAGALVKAGRLDEAHEHAELGLRLAPEGDRRTRTAALEQLTRIAIARKDRAAAAGYAERAQALDPTLPLPIYVQAMEHYQAGRYREAAPLFAEAVRQVAARTVAMSELHFYAGDTLARLERHAEAEAQFRREVRLFPTDGRAWAGLAMLYRATGRDSEAEQAIADLLRSVPTDEGRDLAARLWTLFGEPERARALRPDPVGREF